MAPDQPHSSPQADVHAVQAAAALSAVADEQSNLEDTASPPAQEETCDASPQEMLPDEHMQSMQAACIGQQSATEMECMEPEPVPASADHATGNPAELPTTDQPSPQQFQDAKLPQSEQQQNQAEVPPLQQAADAAASEAAAFPAAQMQDDSAAVLNQHESAAMDADAQPAAPTEQPLSPISSEPAAAGAREAVQDVPISAVPSQAAATWVLDNPMFENPMFEDARPAEAEAAADAGASAELPASTAAVAPGRKVCSNGMPSVFQYPRNAAWGNSLRWSCAARQPARLLRSTSHNDNESQIAGICRTCPWSHWHLRAHFMRSACSLWQMCGALATQMQQQLMIEVSCLSTDIAHSCWPIAEESL